MTWWQIMVAVSFAVVFAALLAGALIDTDVPGDDDDTPNDDEDPR